MTIHPQSRPQSQVTICKCDNGTPAKGTACDKHGSNSCQQCKTGFKLNDKKTACIAGGDSCCSIIDCGLRFICFCIKK